MMLERENYKLKFFKRVGGMDFNVWMEIDYK